MPDDTPAASIGFAPIARVDATVLILGSLPGRRSLEAGQYYAHAQNVFWRIMSESLGIGGSYSRRCEQLKTCGIALWDVLEQSVRPGSMDADIRLGTARANDFAGFFREHPGLRRVCFNGKKAEALYRRLVVPDLVDPAHELVSLPSTSPAYASMSFDKKLEIWRSMLAPDQ